ncbi:MAG TPA: PorV/PorQ family protein [Bacteroidota bacterium]|nr:PorV/PorQ family protein [Bacteroidota bacterium]
MKKIVVLVMVMTSACLADVKIGKYAGEFMAIGVGGRALGMGSAYTALATDVTAGYWNPAGLARIMYPEIALMHDERYGNLVNYDYVAVALPFGANVTNAETGAVDYRASSIGLSVVRLGIDAIADTRRAWNDINGNGIFDDGAGVRPDYSQITFFNAADYAMYLTYAKQYSAKFSLGVNMKLIRRNIGEFHGTGIGFDAGVMYLPTPRLFLGATVQDITTTLVAWSTGTNELISPTVKLGAAYRIDALGGRFTPAVGTDVRFENRKFSARVNVGPVSFDPVFGLEYEYKNVFALRGGYNDVGSVTVGAGIHLRKLDIDYSFAKFDANDQLGNTHRISLRITLQEDKFRRGGSQ